MHRILVALGVFLLPLAGIAADKNAGDEESSNWCALEPLATPTLPDTMPPVSAGCVVVGHHILVDGMVAAPRILKGAFAGDVDAGLQREFSTRAIEAAKDWRFEYVGNQEEPWAAFHMETVGFLPADGAGTRAVVGVSDQFEGLREACEVTDLAAWGIENAVSVEQALAANGDGVLLDSPELPGSYWVTLGELAPAEYPFAAVKAGVEGCVMVGYMIEAGGRVDGLKITASNFTANSRHEEREALQNSAALAASQWKFAPGPDNLARLPEFRQTPMTFSLSGVGADGAPKCSPVDVTAATAEAANGDLAAER